MVCPNWQGFSPEDVGSWGKLQVRILRSSSLSYLRHWPVLCGSGNRGQAGCGKPSTILSLTALGTELPAASLHWLVSHPPYVFMKMLSLVS